MKDRTEEFKKSDELETEDLQQEDDGESVIFNMNVEGMPGYRPELDPEKQAAGKNEIRPEGLNTRQTGQVILTATLTALMVGLIFSAVMILFTLFCTGVWFA